MGGGERPDDGEVTGARDDHDRVPDLVVAEDLGNGVRPPHRENPGAGAVQEPHRADQDELGRAQVMDRRGQGDRREPSDQQVGPGGETKRRLEPDRDCHHGGSYPKPSEAEHDERDRAGDPEQTVRSEARRDEHVDHRVVGLARTPAGGGRPGQQVVAGAHGVQPYESERVQPHTSADAVSTNENDTGGKRHNKRPEMDETTPPG